ncbi:hypothetical protein K3495_g2864 [Podosphaera aphanis]|nr:hypothetical protein K3495_g2864 [Podosphaera aphanis]
MRLSASILLLGLTSIISASPNASVYIFPRRSSPNVSNIPVLSPEQARLVLAQRLGVSRYHRLGDASESTISYINEFGRQDVSLVENSAERVAELVLIVEGVSHKNAQRLLDELSTAQPDFAISNAPSMTANSKLVSDLQIQTKQTGHECSLEKAINPFDKSCWTSNAKIIHIDLLDNKNKLDDVINAQAQLRRLSNRGVISSAILLMPELSRKTQSSTSAYGSYEMVYLGHKKSLETAIDPSKSTKYSSPLQISKSSDKLKPIKGVQDFCHNSLDSCISSTNNCSGHGECFEKYGKRDNNGACFACGCRATNETVTWAKGTKKGWTISHWGGSACHKRDVSSAFWLISIFSIVMVAVVGWGIGLLYSIGENKLPGVIGAGVSVKQR